MGERVLGVPTVGDRIAQTAVTLVLEPELESVFHEDSYGYRRGKSAHDALAVTRKRCWERDWVLEYDIRGLFDNIDHGLLLKALRHHCDKRWVLLLVERWLTAPMQGANGEQDPRTVGTPQGGPLSPVLANLFLHYALDRWLATHHSGVPFCRYADDGILHCRSRAEANEMREHLDARLRQVGLELHPEKTRVVYCKDVRRPGRAEHETFDFLGYTFRPRTARNRYGRLFTTFTPAISRSALSSIRQTVRGWRLHLKSHTSLAALARQIAPVVRGWIGYYGRFRPSELPEGCQSSGSRTDPMGHEEIQAPSSASASRQRVARWHEGGATRPVRTLVGQRCVCGWNNGSPVNREVHAGFCEKLGVRFPRLTHLDLPSSLIRRIHHLFAYGHRSSH